MSRYVDRYENSDGWNVELSFEFDDDGGFVYRHFMSSYAGSGATDVAGVVEGAGGDVVVVEGPGRDVVLVFDGDGNGEWPPKGARFKATVHDEVLLVENFFTPLRRER